MKSKKHKTRKFPDMFGSIRRHKYADRARKFDFHMRQRFGNDCFACVSEPICLTSKL